MAKSEIEYPLPGFHFSVSFPGQDFSEIDARFQEISGLSADLETFDLKEGGENRFTHKLPVRTKYPNLVLKRAIFPLSSKLIEWAQNAIFNFDIKPVNIQVFLLNDKHEPVKEWNFIRAYPVKIQTSALNAKSNELVIETLELVYQYAKRKQ